MVSNKNPDFTPLGSGPLGDVKAKMKAQNKLARKALYQSLWTLASGLILHYVITLATVAVIAAAGFSSVPRAALSATALGLLARWFLPNKARVQADQRLRQSQFQQIELTPDQLKEFMAGLNKATGLSEYDTPLPKTSPYL